MTLIKEDIDRLRVLIDESPKKMVIVSHTNPDGDAIGSSLAWGALLERKGHEVTYVVPNKYPYFLDWMADINKFRIFKDDASGETAAKIAEADVIFCLDFNMVSRLEGLSDAISANTGAVFVLVDHHLDPPREDFDLIFSHPGYSSTSFLIYDIIVMLAGLDAIDRNMAESMFVGMMTDTGNFSFSFLTAELFEAVAEIVRKGVNIPQVHANVYNSFTIERVKLLGHALNKMDTMKVGDMGVAWITLKESELRRFKFQQGDSEGFVNYPLTVRDLSMSVIFIETRHFIRVSLRSRGDVDVSLFAKLYFGGGGHKNASGGKSFQPMPETVAYFKKCVEEFFGPGGAYDKTGTRQ